jgi:hypothetical protein
VTRGDRIVVLVVALLAVLSWPATMMAAAGRADVAVITGPTGTTDVSLGQDAALDVEGLRGIVRVETSGEAVRVVASSCPDHLCVAQGPVSARGSAIVCVPNGVTVRLGGSGHALDSVVR